MGRSGTTKYGTNKFEHRFGTKQKLQRINNLGKAKRRNVE